MGARFTISIAVRRKGTDVIDTNSSHERNKSTVREDCALYQILVMDLERELGRRIGCADYPSKR